MSAEGTKPHRSPEHGPWSWCSKAAEDRALFHGGSTLLLIYRALCRIESDTPEGSKNCFYASTTGIASRCGLNARTVRRFLPLIAQAGLAVIISGRNSGENRSHEANRFTLLNVGQGATLGVSCPKPLGVSGPKLRTENGPRLGRQERKTKSLKKEAARSGGACADAHAPDGGGDDDWKPLQ